jgi:hypothetical protein
LIEGDAVLAETFQPNDTRPTCSETLGSFAANLRYEALPAAAIRRLQDHVGHAQPRIEAVELRLTGIGVQEARIAVQPPNRGALNARIELNLHRFNQQG